MRGDGERTAVILDRHPLWLDALERLLERIGVMVVGTTSSAAEALDLIEQNRPALFITEYDGSQEGLETLRRASATSPQVKSVVLSADEDEARIAAAFDAGAFVYCARTAEPEDLAAAIRQAFNSSIYYAGPRRPPQSLEGFVDRRPAPPLTKREIEILRLAAEGYSNSQLAKMLWVTEQTVKFHLSNIYRKLEVTNRTEASRWAQVHGLLAEVREVAPAVA